MRRFMKFVCALIIVMVSFSVDASAQKKGF